MTHLHSAFRSLATAATLALGLAAAGGAAAEPRILAIGDSMLAANSNAGRSVAAYLEKLLGETVMDRSTAGAHMIYRLPLTGAMGLSIPSQFRGVGWDVVVMNGGGNDLWLGCGCNRCDRRLNKMIVPEGNRGRLVQLFAEIIASGAQVVYVGYLRSPGIHTPIEACKDEGDELEARVARLAARVPGIHYVSLQDLVPYGDASYFAFDGIHPSAKASQEIALRVAETLKQRGL